ncbi:Ribonuclease [Klebsormidium nitens]|uniref:Ribonuclease n=1 Tax=Klebsormidium nitens TaxID=105231 RepID=A0A1Y1II42_KLENI|nr:Ribonuclease [Klebsormidium nitens]|eukprot:GAQ90373.1 Ribonuclease [Klebsormidium nitens]
MFFDLNLPNDGKNELLRRAMVAQAICSGYDGVAHNHTVAGRMMTSDDTCKSQPVKLESAIAAAAGVAGAARSLQSIGADRSGPGFQQLNRITMVIEDASQASSLSSANPVLASYDIVAVEPTNARTFMQACTSLEVDLIALSLGSRRSFRFRQQDVRAALDRGLHFEISYSGLFQDGQSRRQLLTNAQALVKMTRGKNIILSSGASQTTDLRNPYDVRNLATLLGLNFAHAKAATSQRATAVILRGETRRSTLRGAVAVQTLPTPPSRPSANAERQETGGARPVDEGLSTSEVGVSAMEIEQATGELTRLANETSGGQEGDEHNGRAHSGLPSALLGQSSQASPSAFSTQATLSVASGEVDGEWTTVQGRSKAGRASASKQRRKQRNRFMKIQL